MIVASVDDGFRLITQNDHATLSGQLCEHWGNETTDAHEFHHSVTAAAYLHDNGWWEFDLGPRTDSTGSPLNFLQSPKQTWVGFYQRGVENVIDLDRYGGLLVSMHGSGIRRRRYATQPDMPQRKHDYSEFIADQESIQQGLAAELQAAGKVTADDRQMLKNLHEAGNYDRGGVSLWQAYKLVQLMDRLSLYFCMNGTLKTETIYPAPVTTDNDVELTIEPIGSDIRIEPYPFDTEPFDVTLPARTIPQQEYESRRGIVEAYFRATREPVTFTLVG